MKVFITVLLLSRLALAVDKEHDVIGTSIFAGPPIVRGIDVQIKNNVIRLGYRYINQKTCFQYLTFNEKGIITNYAEEGICGSKIGIIAF